jgi:glycosyltransferase involved in cell wall biosynthesis
MGQALGSANASEARGTILMVDDQMPEHDVHAGALTTFHYLRILRETGLRVIFRPDDGLRREPYASDLEASGVHILTGDEDLADWLKVNGSAIDQVLLSRPLVARRHLRSVRQYSDARVSYLDHDLHFLRERRRYEASGDPEALSESRRLLEIETDIFRGVDAVLTFSPAEVADIERLAPGADVRVVTPAFYASPSRPHSMPVEPAVADRHDIVFVGAYDHLPNVDAAEVLVDEIMPLIWAEQPGTRVWLIGGHVPAAVLSLASEHVRVTGHVPELQPYWARARVALLPLRFGSGVKGKVIASLEAGVPVVTTTIGNEGIGLVHGRDALISDRPDALAAHVVELLRDGALAASLADAGRLVLETRFSEDQVRADLVSALDLL